MYDFNHSFSLFRYSDWKSKLTTCFLYNIDQFSYHVTHSSVIFIILCRWLRNRMTLSLIWITVIYTCNVNNCTLVLVFCCLSLGHSASPFVIKLNLITIWSPVRNKLIRMKFTVSYMYIPKILDLPSLILGILAFLISIYMSILLH